MLRELNQELPQWGHLFNLMTSYLWKHYELGVELVNHTSDISSDEVANLSNGRILLSFARTTEQQCYILAHVFGHLIQHKSRAKYLELLLQIDRPPPVDIQGLLKCQYFRYEMEAYGWGEELIRQCSSVSDILLHRYSTYAAVDFATYCLYLRTGKRTSDSKFQLHYINSLSSRKRRLWPRIQAAMPNALIVNELEISVK